MNRKISNDITIENSNNDKYSNRLTSRKNTKIIEIEIETSGQNNEISLKEIKFEEDKNINENSINNNNNNGNKISNNKSNPITIIIVIIK